MSLHYFRCYLSEEGSATIATLRRACSNSRKVMWLLKSFNHVEDMFKRIRSGAFNESFCDRIDFVEQIFLVRRILSFLMIVTERGV